MFEPVIKWSGSKRSQAETILQYFPKDIATYYEPFCGGASVLRRLLDTNIKVKHYVCSDINEGLIALWNMIVNNPKAVSSHYRKLWKELNKDDDTERKKEYYMYIRERYNQEHNPLDFMFIMRTAVNGMPRYNNTGKFNTSYHLTRNGIVPNKLDKIVYEWSGVLKSNNVQFLSCSYDEISPDKNDFMYLDPPYANTKGMYYGSIDLNNFWGYLRNLQCRYILSFDGISSESDNTYNIPEDVYSRHEYILSGNSSFRRITGKSNNTVVQESLYIR